jgi:HSP20 family protein
MSRLMDEMFRFPLTEVTQATYPFADVVETGDAYAVTVEIPGVTREDIELTVQDNTLSLRLSKKAEAKEEGKTYRHVERFYGTFERHFPFSTAVDSSKVKASYKDGVLEITLPKAENARERHIEVDVQ